MKKTLKNAGSLVMACIAFVTGAVSCGGNGNDVPENTEPAKVVSTSIAEGSTVDASVTEISVEYSEPVVLNPSASATLNGSNVPVSLVDGKVLKATVSLSAGTSYEFQIPSRMVVTLSSKKNADAFTLKFKTQEANFPQEDMSLVNANAIAQARNVYKFISDNIGKKIISGAMANVNNNNDFADWILKETGVYPALTCYDFVHLPESGQNWIDYADITPATTQWNNNGLVAYMWHWRVPTSKEAYDNKDYNKYGFNVPGGDNDSPTEFDIREALKEGTWQNECILSDIDKVSEYLKLLQDKGIPVIWRPLHEAAGSYVYNNPWFWWGRFGGEYTKQLWNLMYDRMVNKNGLNNLIWVWTTQYSEGHEQQMAADYPGNDKVDVIGVDIYASEGDDSSQLKAYEAARNLGGNKKPVSLAETGYLQNPDKCIADKANWSWFMLWYTYDIHKNGGAQDGFGNSVQHLKDVYTSPYVINRGNMPDLKK